MRKNIIIFIIICFMSINTNSYALEENSNNTSSINNSIPTIIISGLGFLIGLSVTTMIVLLEPKSLSISSETFYLKNEIPSDNLIFANMYGLSYKFNNFIELNPSLILVNNKSNLFSLDLGINLNNNNVIEKEKFGLSPFFSLGLSANSSNISNIGYGVYAKTGLTMKVDRLLMDFFLGYRIIENTVYSSNSLTLGGNIGYKI
jgi:hypothetical protein